MKKFTHVSFVLLVAVLLVLSNVPLTARAADPVQLRIFVGLGTGTHDTDKVVEDALAKKWNDAHPDIQIKFDYNDNSTARDVLLTQAASDTPPDIAGPAGIRAVNETGQLWADLTPYIEKDKAALNLDDYDPAVLSLFKSLGGKNLSVALGIYPSFMWINEDIFKAADVPLPPKEFGATYKDRDGKVHPWDWETVGLIAKQLTADKSGKYADEAGFDPKNIAIYGFTNMWSDMRHIANEWGAADNGVAADLKTATFNQAAFVKAAKWYQDAIFNQHFMPDSAAEGGLQQGTSPFESAKVAMWYSHTWYNFAIPGIKFKWGIYASPAVPGTDGKKIVAPMHADTYAVLDKSKHKDQAWEVVKWLNSPDIASQLCGIFGCIPARKSARAGWEKATKDKIPQFDLNVIETAAKYPDVPNHEGYLPNQAKAKDAYDAFWSRLKTDPTVNVEKELSDLNKTEQGIFQGNFPPTPTPAPTAAK